MHQRKGACTACTRCLQRIVLNADLLNIGTFETLLPGASS